MSGQSLFEGPEALNVICPGDPRGASFGFTSERFDDGSYLWLDEVKRVIYISMIISLDEGKGHVRSLFDAIESAGYRLKVPTPSDRMRKICERRGMISVSEETNMGNCEVMVKP